MMTQQDEDIQLTAANQLQGVHKYISGVIAKSQTIPQYLPNISVISAV